VNRRDFLELRRGRERVLELSCESLHMRWVDAIGRTARTASDDAAPWESGEPPLRVAAETEDDLLAELDRSLAAADVLRVSDTEWLRDSPLEREVASRIESFRKRGGRILVALVACALFTAPAAAQISSDAALRARVEAALAAASDLPADSIAVQVQGGIVTLSGSVLCDGCGGNATPGGVGTVQQSLGAVVRAIPGVTDLRFSLRYRPPPAR
jgi:hypothetical protein